MFANKLSDLDDFLTPSLECVKPLQPGTKMTLDQDMGALDTGVRPDLIKSSGDKIASVTLQDCLACSGCVTSAETVLIQQHSIAEFLKLKGPISVGVSPQSLASLTEKFGGEDLQNFYRLKTVFGAMNIECFDFSLFNGMSLHMAYQEFAARNGVKSEKGFYGKDSDMPLICSECPGWVCYAEKRCGDLALPHMSKVKSA